MWIEINLLNSFSVMIKSHPARGVWIEIVARIYTKSEQCVAPREGCVD